jgi:cellulose synthase/poly-beta-1,6-N-acetylglucosamine synthase-like glycosyltransferase
MATLAQIVGWVLLAAACLLLLPALVLLVQVCVAMWPQRRSVEEHHAQRPSLAVLMPAHDESAGIAAAIAAVLPQLGASDRLLVVADNCTDDTAQVARDSGAEVVERCDALRRGKGYALDFGVRALEASPPEVVVIVDADCHLAPNGLARLASRCVSAQRPVQALYLMHAPADAGLKTRIAEFAWIVKNQVRPLGYRRLGLPCQLMGTGMAFPWPVIRDSPLATGHLVEDLQLGLDLAARGFPPLFCPEVSVTSAFPTHAAGLASQRTRWEHGHLGVIAAVAPRLFWQAATSGRLALGLMALDLCVPPLAWLVLVSCGVAVLGAVMAGLGGPVLPLSFALSALFLVAVAVLLAWHGFGRRAVSLVELLSAPGYAFAKLPIYIRLLRKRQTDWVRTRRGDKAR